MKRLDVVALLALITIGGSQPTGTAQSAECTPSGGLTFICGIQNPEDLVLVPNTRWLLASGMAPGSGLHLVDTRTKTVRTLNPARNVTAPGRHAHENGSELVSRHRVGQPSGPNQVLKLSRHPRSKARRSTRAQPQTGIKRSLHRLRHEPWWP